MDQQIADDENKNSEIVCDDDKTSAVNSLILDYYKKFGKKRDLEQFFSLSTAQNEIRDPCSSFWKKMKALSDSSESADKKSESSAELCRISVRCSIPEPNRTSNRKDNRPVSDIDSPPIITEVLESRHSDNQSEMSDDIHSLKSVDGTLDLSINKVHSPTSSVTSHRKLEWDSLADVGYGNESDKKTSASSLSTLERLALQQQYCINDTQQSNLGLPTAHSTPLEVNNSKTKGKKDLIKKSTKISSKEIDCIEMTLPQIPETSQAINLSLTKHITFNVDKKGEINVEKITKNISSSPEKVSVETYMTPDVKLDKEIQTTLLKENLHKPDNNTIKKPVCFNLNTLKKRIRKKKLRKVRRKTREPKSLNKAMAKKKSGEQVSAAESFEYMPGHIYNQNHMHISQGKQGNKSSLESSIGHTTDSSREQNSFTKDLEKSIDLLKITLNRGSANGEIKKKLIKEIVHRILKTRYKDDESTDFLSGLSYDSKKLDLVHTSTSTSDGNDTIAKKLNIPKKSILRIDRFNSNLPSTSQSTPNLPSVIKNEVNKANAASNTDSDQTKDAKTSSEELYQKYLKALKREQAYKQHLKDKEILFKQKLVGSDPRINQDVESQNRIKHLMKDLVRNNYDDGSGDASKLEGGSVRNINLNPYNAIRNNKSHSVFTLSSGTSNSQQKTKKADIGTTATCSKIEKHYCCCPIHATHKIGVTDSSVQVNIECCDKTQCTKTNITQKCDVQTQSAMKPETNIKKGEIKYVCLCKETDSQGVPDNILIYKCSRLDTVGKDEVGLQQSIHCSNSHCCKYKESVPNFQSSFKKPSDRVQSFAKQCLNIQESSSSKSSQTNLDLDVILRRKCSDKSGTSSSTDQPSPFLVLNSDKKLSVIPKTIQEAVRWTQTDISINPKISNPSFSDINIVNSQDCWQLVSKHYKEVSRENIKTSSDEMTDLVTDSSAKSLNKKLTSGEEQNEVHREIQSDGDVCTVNNVGSQSDLQKKRNYSIPIEGTNMTLKVSLRDRDSISPDIIMKPESEVTKIAILEAKETLTYKPTNKENPTSLLEECSVGVQSTDNNIFNDYYKQSTPSNSCKDDLKMKKDDLKSEMTTQIDSLGKFHTYPKGDQVNPLKPLLRSNTDTSRIEKASHVSFDQFKQEYKINLSTGKLPKTSQEQECSSTEKTSQNNKESQSSKTTSDSESQTKSKSSIDSSKTDEVNDPLIDLIQNITKRYSKKDIEKSKRKKCFKEIITVLNYLLDTEESSDQKASSSAEDAKEIIAEKESQTKEFVDKGVQLSKPKTKKHLESSDPTSTDLPTTSTDSTTCHVLNKIKKECERYHQRRCKKNEESSSTSMNRDHRRAHCYCKGHKCKLTEKNKKKCIAYNLIVQSDSLVSDETVCQNNNPPLRNIIVKVPKKKYEKVPLKEMCAKLEREVPHCTKVHRSKSLPNDSEVSSTEDIRQVQAFSVREYLERNRPDFVDKCSQRQNCLKMINKTRANERAAKREMLSLQVGRQQTLNTLSDAEIQVFAAQLGKQLRTKKLAPKFICERDMKKHSEKIYKSLPEVMNKKEQIKKESIKKTNLLLASIFKRNLQKKTLQGAVNLSNYSTIIKI